MKVTESRLSRVDLNLLNAFQILMAERSVTRAAQRMFISQPAMSNTLRRLRDMFDDPLFIPSQTGLLPTPKAMELASPIEVALAQLEATIFSSSFDPAQAVGKINIQIPDSHSSALIPALYSRVQKNAQNIYLSVDDTSNRHLELLAAGKSDFSIYVEEDYGADFITFPLGTIPAVCWMRKGHPLSTVDDLSMADILTYPLVGLTYHDQRSKPITTNHHAAQIRKFNQDYQLENITRLRTSQLLTALTVIVESDALMMGLEFQFRSQDILQGLTKKPVRETRNLKSSLAVIQHKRTETSQLHIWIRQQIQESWLDGGLK